MSKVRHTICFLLCMVLPTIYLRTEGNLTCFTEEPTVFTIHTLFIVMMLNSSTSKHKTSNHLSHQLVIERKKRDQEIHGVGNSCLVLGQTQKCGGVKPVNRVSNGNRYVNK